MQFQVLVEDWLWVLQLWIWLQIWLQVQFQVLVEDWLWVLQLQIRLQIWLQVQFQVCVRDWGTGSSSQG